MRVETAPLGTPHPRAKCRWCSAHLIVNSVEQLRCWLCPNCYERQIAYGVFVQYSAAKARELGLPTAGRYCWHVPLPSQVAPYEWQASFPGYLLWGGMAGPGKSTGGRWWLYHRSLTVPGHEALLLRENNDQLEANHTLKMAVEVPRLGGVWYESKKLAVFGKGSDQALIHCGHMADLAAVQRYLGVEYGAILADEAALYPVTPEGATVLAELSTRARKEYVNREGRVVAPVFMPVTNPGGPSAPWLYEMCIAREPDYERYPALRPEFDETGTQIGGYRPEQWQFLKATLDENPYMRDDYRRTTLAVLSGTRYKQLAEGDWSAFDGQFFAEWEERYHVRTAAIAA